MARRGQVKKTRKRARRTHKHFFYSQLVFLSIGILLLLGISLLGTWTVRAMNEQKVTDQENLVKKDNLIKTLLLQSQKPIDGIVTHGSREKKEIALTFDADMTPGMAQDLARKVVPTYYNESIIDYLNETNTKATLFLTGMWIEQYPEATRELANNPLFELANHSYSHPGFAGECYGLAPVGQFSKQEEMEKTQRLLASYGIYSRYFRFPGGCANPEDVALANQLGLTVVHWDVVGGDGFETDRQRIIDNVLNNTQNGSIIVLHMQGGPLAPETGFVLPRLIQTLKNEGYIFVTVSELLSDSSEQ